MVEHANIDHLDMLMQQTHSNLLQLASIAEMAQEERMRSSNILACHTELFLLLMYFRFNFSSQRLAEISSHINTDILVHNAAAQEHKLAGWEEITYASLTFLLKHVLTSSGNLKSKKENVPSPDMSFPATTEKLKSRLAMLCDRLLITR